MTKRSILVGQIWHEGHSFNPNLTSRDDFRFVRGEAVLDEARASATALSGIVKEAERTGYVCVPALIARSRPGGAVEQNVLDDIIEEFVEIARTASYDAICFDLHGATLGSTMADVEGELLERLRAVVPAGTTISIALDLHAYMTPKMAENASIITAFRTTPHSDIEETGVRAMRLLNRLLKQDIRPRAVYSLIPFLTRGNDETSSGPMFEILKVADDAWRSRPDLLELSIFNVHPFLDVPGYGQVVLSYDYGDGSAIEANRAISKLLWEKRDEFKEQLPSVEKALSLAATSDIPFALGDQGDRVMGAGPGDSPEIARIALQKFSDLRVAVPVYDPDAVEASAKAGEGSTLTINIGGHTTHSIAPLEGNWTVKRLTRARFLNAGPYMGGVESDFGDAAVLQQGNVTVIVTTMAPNVHDPAFYEAVGIPLTSQHAVVARAANHYKISFADCARAITVDTPGLTAFRPHEFPFDRARPFHPLDPVEWQFNPLVIG